MSHPALPASCTSCPGHTGTWRLCKCLPSLSSQHVRAGSCLGPELPSPAGSEHEGHCQSTKALPWVLAAWPHLQGIWVHLGLGGSGVVREGSPKNFPINAGEAKPKLKSKRAGGIGILLMAGSEQCYFPSQGELWLAPLRDGSSMQQMQGRSVCQEPVS